MGFSVTGRVLNSLEGDGVPDATVTLNNQIKGNHGDIHHPISLLLSVFKFGGEISEIALFD